MKHIHIFFVNGLLADRIDALDPSTMSIQNYKSDVDKYATLNRPYIRNYDLFIINVHIRTIFAEPWIGVVILYHNPSIQRQIFIRERR